MLVPGISTKVNIIEIKEKLSPLENRFIFGWILGVVRKDLSCTCTIFLFKIYNFLNKFIIIIYFEEQFA
jgi:hypothetical protein